MPIEVGKVKSSHSGLVFMSLDDAMTRNLQSVAGRYSKGPVKGIINALETREGMKLKALIACVGLETIEPMIIQSPKNDGNYYLDWANTNKTQLKEDDEHYYYKEDDSTINEMNIEWDFDFEQNEFEFGPDIDPNVLKYIEW